MTQENLIAQLHVQRVLLAALCATHPNQTALQSAFAFHLEQAADRLGSQAQLLAAVAMWSADFQRHMTQDPASGA